MTLTVPDAVQLAFAMGFVGGAFYWGGQVKAMLKKLCTTTEDHEHRIRRIEGIED